MNSSKSRTAMLAIAANTVLVIGKLSVGAISGSVAVISEGVHSATDVVASIVTFLSVQASDSPADEEHPYGHGKIESFSSLIEAALIFGAAVFIVYEAVHRLSAEHAHPVDLRAPLVVMGISALFSFLLSGYMERMARSTDSQALHADAAHIRTDVMSAVGVFAGLVLSRLTGAAWLDPVVGLVVAALILRTSYELTRDAVQPLMDARLPRQEEKRIVDILEREPRVLGYHKLRTRKSGSQRLADVHVQIDDECSLVQAHDFTEELEDSIRDALPHIDIHIHIEPYRAEMRHQQEVHGRTPEEVNLKRQTSPEAVAANEEEDWIPPS